MGNTASGRIIRALRAYENHRREVAALVLASLFVVFGVTVALRNTGVAASQPEQVLDCQVTGPVAHSHDASCYDGSGNLVCPLPEVELHAHTDDCYVDTYELACEIEEHAHGPECYDSADGLVCELPEHVHTDSCYTSERVLVCSEEEITVEHVHGPGCFTTVAAEAEAPTDEAASLAEAAVDLAAEEAALAEDASAQHVTHTISGSDEAYEVVVTYDEDAQIPEEATLRVTELAANSPESERARNAVLADKQAKGEWIDLDSLGFAALDISILDADGNEVEPAAEVQVDITIKELPGVEDLDEVADQLAIQHHVETRDGVIVDEVFSGSAAAEFGLPADESVAREKASAAVDPANFAEEDYQAGFQAEAVRAERNDSELRASFPAPCFSTFSITWQYNTYWNRSVTVHYGYLSEGTFHEFGQQPAPTPAQGFAGTTEAYLTYDFAGWQATNEVYYQTRATSTPQRGGTRIQNTLYKGYSSGNWLYNAYNSNTMPLYGSYYGHDYRSDIASNVLGNNSHIYVLYEQCPQPTQGGSPVPTNEDADKPQDPAITKTSEVNHDGTNTIHLTVEGHTTPLRAKGMADVILVFDTSGSMRYRMDAEVEAGQGDTDRITATKNAATSLINTLLNQNDGDNGDNAKFRVGLVPFSNVAHGTVELTADGTTLAEAIEGLTPDGGTNWEDALQKANEMSVASDRATFVIFLTDGNPTFRMTRGSYTDAQLGTINTGSPNPNTDLSNYHAQYNVFGPGNGDFETDANAIPNNYVSPTGSAGEGRNYEAALAQAQSIVGNNKNFYTLGIGPAVGRLEAFTSDAGAAGNYYVATDVDALNEAMESIIAQIKGELGYSNFCITDGITPLTQTVQKAAVGADLPAEDDFVYEKYRAATQEDVDAGVAAEAGVQGWFAWDPTSEGANTARYNSTTGAVEWNLGETFFLEEGARYRCSFKVWPSQEAYDTIAQLNNGTLSYDALDAATRTQITGSNATGYTLMTNMPNDPAAQEALGSEVGASYSYGQATKVAGVVSALEDTEETGSFDPVDSLDLEKRQLTIKKEWQNALDSRMQTGSVALNVVAADAPAGQEPFATVEVRSDSSPAWTNSVYVSTGLLKVVDGEVLVYEHGHDFSLAEGEDLAYHWELVADTYRPMVITDADRGYSEPTSVLLKRVLDDATAGEYDYEIDGGKYQIVQEGTGALSAINYRRSNLNLTKRVVGKDGETDISDDVRDELFEFAITVVDKSGHDVWLSVFESTAADAQLVGADDLYVTGALPEEPGDGGTGEPTGYYYVASGQEFVVRLKAGWNLRLINLPTGSTYTIREVAKEGYEFMGATIDAGEVAVDVDAATASGTIGATNTSFTITAVNRMTMSTVLIKKTNLEGNQALEGATFKLFRKNEQDKYELVRDTFAVGADGYSCVGLVAGEYKLEEQTPPPGYIITVKEAYFTVSDGEGSVITLADGTSMAEVSGDEGDVLVVKNEPGAELPHAGGKGTRGFYAAGFAMVAGAVVNFVLRRDS